MKTKFILNFLSIITLFDKWLLPVNLSYNYPKVLVKLKIAINVKINPNIYEINSLGSSLINAYSPNKYPDKYIGNLAASFEVIYSVFSDFFF